MSLANLNVKLEDTLRNALEAKLKLEISEVFDLKMKELNERKNEICSGILIKMMGYVEVARAGQNIIFTIKEIKQ